MQQDVSFHDQNRAGELVSRLATDSVLVSKSLTSNVSEGLRSSLLIVCGLAAMFFTNSHLTVH
jgi:ABC-type multidrug transport system fused ATPase/permease subunit